MADWSHGSAYPYLIHGDAQNRDLTFTDSPTPRHVGRGSVHAELGRSSGCSDRLRRAQRSSARRVSIERHGAVSAHVPVWLSRSSWTDSVRVWAVSPAFRPVCVALGKRGVISAAALVTVAVAMADFADHSTGRNVAVTNRVLASRAGCSERTVTTARTVLAAAGLAVEAQRGHGSAGTHTVGNRPSIWHLVSRAEAAPGPSKTAPGDGAQKAPNRAAAHGRNGLADVDTCDLPPKAGSCSSTLVESYSPSASIRTREDISTKNQHPAPRRPGRATPRPLALQRLAAGLVTPVTGPDDRGGSGRRSALILGLDHGHIGTICDALIGAGINPAAWTATAITAALNADMRRSGQSWPDRLERPGAFLAWRLRRMLAWPENATKNTGSTAAGGLDQNQSGAGFEPSRSAPLTACQDTDHHAGPGLRQSAPPAPTTAPRNLLSSTACSGCGSADAPRRPYLPAARAHVCDTCWEAFSTCA